MFHHVKKGDILLIPRLPSWDEIAIVEATKDWNIGYRFEIDANFLDYGHIFPAKYLRKFTRYSTHVSGNLRSTLKNRLRFWNINHYEQDIEQLLTTCEPELLIHQDHNSRFESSIGYVFNELFDEKAFADNLFTKLSEQFNNEEWEYALVYGLRILFPYYQVDRVGGREENKHGTDILIKIPNILSDYEYAIAIQVKDYEGCVGKEVIEQINKADQYWKDKNIKLIEKFVIVTKAGKANNISLIENDSNIKFIFAEELKQLLSEIGKNFIGMK